LVCALMGNEETTGNSRGKKGKKQTSMKTGWVDNAAGEEMDKSQGGGRRKGARQKSLTKCGGPHPRAGGGKLARGKRKNSKKK